jgi:hypothetical protein
MTVYSEKGVWEDHYRVEIECGERVWERLKVHLTEGRERDGSISTHVLRGQKQYERFIILLSAVGSQCS